MKRRSYHSFVVVYWWVEHNHVIKMGSNHGYTNALEICQNLQFKLPLIFNFWRWSRYNVHAPCFLRLWNIPTFPCSGKNPLGDAHASWPVRGELYLRSHQPSQPLPFLDIVLLNQTLQEQQVYSSTLPASHRILSCLTQATNQTVTMHSTWRFFCYFEFPNSR